MTSTTRPPNGHAETAKIAGELLAFPDVAHNIYRRVSLNSAWTFRQTTGSFDVALSLFDHLARDFQKRCLKEAIDLDPLNWQTLVAAVEQRMQGMVEIVDLTADQIDRRQQLLRDLAARKPVKIVRQVTDIVAAAVGQAVAPLRAALTDVLATAPHALLEVMDGLERSLRDLTPPTPDFAAHKRFSNSMRALDMLGHSTALSLKLRETIVASLRKRCETEHQAAMGAILLDYVTQAVRQAVADFLPFLDELPASPNYS